MIIRLHGLATRYDEEQTLALEREIRARIGKAARRLRDFLDHEGEAALTQPQVQLMAIGRHLRLSSGYKVIVGRRERENVHLEASGVTGVLLMTVDHPGPTTLLAGEPGPEEIELAARITAGYSDGCDGSCRC